MNYVLLMMGGKGTRFNSIIPKQFNVVDGHPIFTYVIRAYEKIDQVDKIIVVTNPEWIDETCSAIESCSFTIPVDIICGGESRTESVRNGIFHLRSFAESEDAVLIHDATHPYVDVAVVRDALMLMKTHRAVTLCQKQYDTCYKIDESGRILDIVPRAEVVSGASPEIFHYGDVLSMFEQIGENDLESLTSIGAMAIKMGLDFVSLPSNYLNLKITHPQDMDTFQILSKTYYNRG